MKIPPHILPCLIADKIHLDWDGAQGWYPSLPGHSNVRFMSYNMALSHILIYHKGSDIYHKQDKEASRTKTAYKTNYVDIPILYTIEAGIGYIHLKDRNLYTTPNDVILCLNQKMENLQKQIKKYPPRPRNKTPMKIPDGKI